MNQPRTTFWLLSAQAKARNASAKVQAMVAAAIDRFFAFVAEVKAIAAEIGWAEYGGKIIRDPDTGDVTGRTPWVPRSEFWPSRPDKTLTEKQAHAVLGKIEEGAKLRPAEQRFVKHIYLCMLDNHARAIA